jgi:hypothetical protein
MRALVTCRRVSSPSLVGLQPRGSKILKARCVVGSMAGGMAGRMAAGVVWN